MRHLQIGAVGLIWWTTMTAAPAHAQAQEKLHVEIQGMVDLWINETVPLHAAITDAQGKAVPTDGLTIRWQANRGYYSNCFTTDPIFFAAGYYDIPAENHLVVAVFRNGTEVAEAVQVVQEPATPDDPSIPVGAAREKSFYDNWTGDAGEPPAQHAAEFMHEIYLADNVAGRDTEVEHFRKALALRPDDPGNLVIEFRIAVALEQHINADKAEEPHLDEAIGMLKHIVEHYDHKAYHHSDPQGGSSNSPAMLVPRALLLLAELTPDAGEAEKYMQQAMADLDWTFRTRKQDLMNMKVEEAPLPGGFDDGPMEAAKRASREAYRQKQKEDAAAGKAIGPYETEVATAAIHLLVDRHVADVQAALQNVMNRYQGPVATAALMEAGARHLMLVVPAVPTTAEAEKGNQPSTSKSP